MAKIVLIIAAIIELIRGLAGLFGSESIAKLFGLEYIEGALVYAHALGALVVTFGIMFMIASKDPVKYRIIMDMGILGFSLAIISYIITYIMVGPFSTFWWIMIGIDIILLILFVTTRPKAAAA